MKKELGFLVAGLCVGWTSAPAFAGQVFSDSFDSDTEWLPPAQWEQSTNWSVVSWGGNKMIENQDVEGTSVTQFLVHRFSNPVPAAWCVDFNYGWQWGGDVPEDCGNYTFVINMDMLDNRQNGYRLSVHQGVLLGGTPDKLVQIYRMRAGGPVSLLAQGKGYGHAGWKGLEMPGPRLYPVRLERGQGGVMKACRETENGWETVAVATDRTYSIFAQIRLGASGWSQSEIPQLDNVQVTVAP